MVESHITAQILTLKIVKVKTHVMNSVIFVKQVPTLGGALNSGTRKQNGFTK
jgi:hypothetical protein